MRSSDYRAGYSAGYTAKRKDRTAAVREERRARFDQFYAAAVTGLLAGVNTWKRGDKHDTTPDDYADTAHAIATAMMRKQP